MKKEIWEAERSDPDSVNYFPFIIICLVLGASFNLKREYNFGVRVQFFNSRFDALENNDGITVLNITHPEHVRYCFVNFHEKDLSVKNDVIMYPLTAKEYLREYYEKTHRL